MAALPVVVAPTRTVTLGSGQALQQRFMLDVQKQSLSDIQSMLRLLSAQLIADQTRKGNPPQFVVVDSKGTTSDVDRAQKKVVAVFGVALAGAAMHEVESALRDAINASTTARSGRLSDVSGSWQWLLIPKGGSPRIVSAGSTLPAFQRGDQLVLMPRAVPYATRVNQLVASSGKLTPKARLVKSKWKEPAKRLQNTGFLFHAAEKVRRRPTFAQFNVRVVFSLAHQVPGEVMSRLQGTGMIVVSPRAVRRKV